MLQIIPLGRTRLARLRTLRGKTTLAFATIGLVTALLGGAATLSVRRIGHSVGEMLDRTISANEFVRDALIDWLTVETTLARGQLQTGPGQAGRVAGAEAVQRVASQFDQVRNDLRAAGGRARSLASLRAGMVALAALDSCAQHGALVSSGNGVEWSLFDRCSGIVNSEIGIFADAITAEMARARDRTLATVATDQRLYLSLTVLALVLAAFTSRGLANHLVRPVTAAADAATRIAAGDTDTSIPRGGADEVGALLQAMATMRDAIHAKVMLESARRRDASVSLDMALRSMAQGLSVFTADGRLRLVNRQFYELYHVTPEAIPVGTAFDDLQAEIVRAGVHAHHVLGPLPDRGRAHGDTWKTMTTLEHLEDGRVMRVARRRTDDGGWVATHEDVTEHTQAQARAAFLTCHDPLTGLPNRALFRDRLETAAAGLGRGGGFAVACIDLDHFKAINEAAGDAVGDQLLCSAANRISGCARETDTVARLGSDEFAVIQSDVTQPAEAASLAERILALLAQPFDIGGHHLEIGASIGIALAPQNGSSADHLLRQAGMAQRRAKAEGRRGFRFFEPEMDSWLQHRRALELDLRAALAQQQFELFYQPVYDLDCETVSGAEALLRWRHPTRGLVLPGEFIPLCEETGLIEPLGRWVLHAAMREAATWGRPITVAVNVSATQFGHGRLLDDVREGLAGAGLPAGRVELEITESVLLDASAAAVATLHALRRLGVKVALDDFGTGYSSLSYLRSFPFDRIKIDQCFVRDIGSNREALAIVRAITSLSDALGMRTTAEGVETAEQMERLRREGCSEVQGYYIGRPLPAEAFRAALLQQSFSRAAAPAALTA